MAEKIARISRSLSWRHEFIRNHDYRCHYCNRFAGSVEAGPDGDPWHVEHMVALAAGGEDAEENLTLSCERCNSLKGTLPYANFRRYAREVFWVGEPSRLTLKQLEYFEACFLRTEDGKWMTRNKDEEGRFVQILAVTLSDSALDDLDLIGEFDTWGTSSRSGGMHNINFALEAHRLAPKLIAEVHLLHAELSLLRTQLAEANGTQQATTDAA